VEVILDCDSVEVIKCNVYKITIDRHDFDIIIVIANIDLVMNKLASL